MEWNLLLIGIGMVVLLGIYILVTVLYRPLRLLFSLAVYMLTGVVLLSALNLVLGCLEMRVAMNLFTVLVAGILHLPGLILLVVLSRWFV